MNRLPVAVLGATGLVGQRFVERLADHPYFEPVALVASERSRGLPYRQRVIWSLDGEIPPPVSDLPLLAADPRELIKRGVRGVFSALPGPLAAPLERECRALGMAVFTNAGPLRMEEDIPIVVAEVNPDHLELAQRQQERHGGFIVAGPNCSTSGLVLALRPLAARGGLCGVSVTTQQAVSGAGRRGLPALDILGTVIPWIAGEEEKIGRETKKILGTVTEAGIAPRPLEIQATCTRVAVREGHLECVDLEFAEEVEIDSLRQELEDFCGLPQKLGLPSAPPCPLIVRNETDRPQPGRDAQAGGPGRGAGMAVTIGRLRQGAGPRRVQLVLLVHNTVRGAAGGCLLNAELAFALGLLKGDTP